MPSLPNTDEPHIIPSGYWKIIAIQDDKFINTASFIMEQDSKRKDNFCDKRVKLSEVQKRSELFIFPSLPIDHKVTEKLFDKNFVGS